MAKSLSVDQLKVLAAHGARARLEELRVEMAAIVRAFPDAATSGETPLPWQTRKKRGAPAKNGRKRRRRTISAAGRAAISAAQKKRWAAIKRKKAANES